MNGILIAYNLDGVLCVKDVWDDARKRREDAKRGRNRNSLTSFLFLSLSRSHWNSDECVSSHAKPVNSSYTFWSNDRSKLSLQFTTYEYNRFYYQRNCSESFSNALRFLTLRRGRMEYFGRKGRTQPTTTKPLRNMNYTIIIYILTLIYFSKAFDLNFLFSLLFLCSLL